MGKEGLYTTYDVFANARARDGQRMGWGGVLRRGRGASLKCVVTFTLRCRNQPFSMSATRSHNCWPPHDLN